MSDLKDYSSDELITELERRDGVRSVHIDEGEFSKITANGPNESKARYLKGYGPGVIITTTRNNYS